MSTRCPECGTPLDEVPLQACATHERDRPDEPKSGSAWYRGWEGGYEPERHNWMGDGWTAYKGGCDLDAPQVSAVSWIALLDAIDDEEDEA